MKNLNHNDKRTSQVERLVFFSDAVFAIAMTLLVIDIKVPEIKGSGISENLFIENLVQLFPQFFGFFLSFFIIGLYWSIHHRMFEFVTNYNGKLVWLNLVFLFSIVLMPFTTSVYSEHSSAENIYFITPYLLYVMNICLTGILQFLLWSHIGNPKNDVSDSFPQGDFLKKAKIRSLLLPFVFILSLLVAILVDPIIGRFVLFLTPFIMALVRDNKKLKHERA